MLSMRSATARKKKIKSVRFYALILSHRTWARRVQMSCCVGLENLCLDNIDWAWWGVVIELVALAYSFVGVALVADNHLVVALETLCVRWNVREDVAGASFMAFGSAAPEIIINAIGTIKALLASRDTPAAAAGDVCASEELANADDISLGIGAIIGSGMIAFTAIPGCCGLIASSTLELKRRPLARDAGAYAIALAMLCIAFSDGVIRTAEAALMVTLYALYLVVVVFSSSVRQHYRVKYLGRSPRSRTSFVVEHAGSAPRESADAQSAYAQSAESGGMASVGREEFGVAPIVAAGGGSLTARSAPIPGSMPPMVVPGEPMLVRATRELERAEERRVWDALPLPAQTSPMEFSSAEMSTSLTSHVHSPTTRSGGLAISRIVAASELAQRPLVAVLQRTCPECAHDSAGASQYPLCLAAAFGWIALFSTVISAVVTRLGMLLGVPEAFLGMCVIAIGAEIPDMIQSVAVARRGYGSMAVSNSTGSQIINILIGLGLPWLLSNLAGHQIKIDEHKQIEVMALFQAANVSLFISLLLLTTWRTWRRGDHSKAQLGRRKGKILLGAYFLCVAGFAMHLFVFK